MKQNEKLTAWIKKTVTSDEPVRDLPGLVAAADASRDVVPLDTWGSVAALQDALIWFADLDPEYGSIDDVTKILQANLTEIIENPHSGRVETNKAIAAAKWFAAQTKNGDVAELASEASMVSDLSFAKEPDIHVYTE